MEKRGILIFSFILSVCFKVEFVCSRLKCYSLFTSDIVGQIERSSAIGRNGYAVFYVFSVPFPVRFNHAMRRIELSIKMLQVFYKIRSQNDMFKSGLIFVWKNATQAFVKPSANFTKHHVIVGNVPLSIQIPIF